MLSSTAAGVSASYSPLFSQLTVSFAKRRCKHLKWFAMMLVHLGQLLGEIRYCLPTSSNRCARDARTHGIQRSCGQRQAFEHNARKVIEAGREKCEKTFKTLILLYLPLSGIQARKNGFIKSKYGRLLLRFICATNTSPAPSNHFLIKSTLLSLPRSKFFAVDFLPFIVQTLHKSVPNELYLTHS